MDEEEKVVSLKEERRKRLVDYVEERVHSQPPPPNDVGLLGHRIIMQTFATATKNQSDGYDMIAGVHFYAVKDNKTSPLGSLRLTIEQWNDVRDQFDRAFAHAKDTLAVACEKLPKT